jgi:hypothetical protein
MTAPVLLIFFNRPGALQTLVDRVLQARPRKVYLASDGPRPGRETDAHLVEECRRIVRTAGWEGEVCERFMGHNLGCGLAVSSAVSWFFEHEDRGMILEDDCHPHPSFFPFCRELLERYRDDDRVMSISGTSFDHPDRRTRRKWSYSFIRQPAVWGWASWRRAWHRYSFDLDPSSIRTLPAGAFPRQFGPSVRRWRRTYQRVARHRINTWDFQWAFSHLLHHGFAIAPSRCLVSNVVSESGTHGSGGAGPWQQLPTESMPFPLVHPPKVEWDEELDAFVDRVHCNHRGRFARAIWKHGQRLGLISTDQVRRGSLWGRS